VHARSIDAVNDPRFNHDTPTNLCDLGPCDWCTWWWSGFRHGEDGTGGYAVVQRLIIFHIFLLDFVLAAV